jgi:signal transduction histidine kinase
MEPPALRDPPPQRLAALRVERCCPISRGPCPGECIYAEIMEGQRLGVVVFDLQRGALEFVNRFARELFQRVRQVPDYESLSRLLLSPGPEGGSDHPARTLRFGAQLLGYTVYRSRSFAWVLVRDITNKARLESIAEAVETMNNIGYCFAAVRHELGNPINSVKAALSVLRANLDTYSGATVAEYLDRIAAEVGRVENLLRSLKSFSLHERPTPRPLELGAFVAQFVKYVEDDARKAGIRVETSLPPQCWASCDPRALQQVLLNLYANARDALRQRDRPEIRILLSRSDGLASLRIADNGAGISEEEARDLFKPFFTTKESGTGLGLVISRKLLARMGATISVESQERRGTTVHLALPECAPGVAPSLPSPP